MFTTIAGTIGALLACTVLVLMAISSPLQEVEQPRRSAPARPRTNPAPAKPVPAPRPTVPMTNRPRHTGTTCVARGTTAQPVR